MQGDFDIWNLLIPLGGQFTNYDKFVLCCINNHFLSIIVSQNICLFSILQSGHSVHVCGSPSPGPVCSPRLRSVCRTPRPSDTRCRTQPRQSPRHRPRQTAWRSPGPASPLPPCSCPPPSNIWSLYSILSLSLIIIITSYRVVIISDSSSASIEPGTQKLCDSSLFNQNYIFCSWVFWFSLFLYLKWQKVGSLLNSLSQYSNCLNLPQNIDFLYLAVYIPHQNMLIHTWSICIKHFECPLEFISGGAAGGHVSGQHKLLQRKHYYH